MIHRVLHKAVRIMWESGERRFPVEQGMELLAEVLCQQDVPSEEVVPITMKEMRWARVAVAKWCEMTQLDSRKVIATEERLFADLKLPTGKTATITGQMDLLLADPPDGIVVVDYKSGFKRPKQPRDLEKSEEEGSGLTELGWVQNLVYSHLILENFPSVDRVIFREIHVLWARNVKPRLYVGRWSD